MPSCKKSRGAVASECSRPGIPPTRTVRRAAFPAALSMVTTIEGLFSGANPLKVGRFPVLPQLFFASRTPALTLNSKQFEAVFVRRLPCKSGSRTPQPSREPSGFDPSKPNKTGVENLIASEPNSRLFPNGHGSDYCRWVRFFKSAAPARLGSNRKKPQACLPCATGTGR